MEQLLTVQDVAKLMRIAPQTVYKWVKERRLPHVILSVGPRKECVRFRPRAIEQWLTERERESKNRPTKWDLR